MLYFCPLDATPLKKFKVFWLNRWSAPEATPRDFVLTKAADDVYYRSVLKDAEGHPIVMSFDDLDASWKGKKLVDSFDPEHVDYLDERATAHENDYRDDRRPLEPEKASHDGDAAEDEDGDNDAGDADVGAARARTVTPEEARDLFPRRTRSGRAVRTPTSHHQAAERNLRARR